MAGERTDFSQADWMFERIVRTLQAFEAALGPDEEVGITFSALPGAVLRVDNVGYWNPDLIKFHGVTGEGRRYELVQHASQVNLLLVALERESREPPRRIGFILEEQLDKARQGGEGAAG